MTAGSEGLMQVRGLADLDPALLALVTRGSGGAGSAAPVSQHRAAEREPVVLSDEQEAVIAAVNEGLDVVVDATVGSGKTSTIQALCSQLPAGTKALYLTYSKLLKQDAQLRVAGAKVQNYHGIVYPSLKMHGIECGISESIQAFNDNFKEIAPTFPVYDLIVIDEYQDITEEYAELLRNIKSLNPIMQVVMVGDMSQKVKSNTRLDVPAFVQEFCESPRMLPFTRSFRVGPELGRRLGEGWTKPIVGVNAAQVVRDVSYSEALERMRTCAPSELLVLGKRNGMADRALNRLETDLPGTFNKQTVFASIRDSDSQVAYGPDAAVFTTFDASKGLERKVCVVFDFDEGFWQMRNSFPNADPEVLRNVFLVAASRGKDEVLFVRGQGAKAVPESEPAIGYVPVRAFSELDEAEPPVYKHPLQAASAFDFMYAENVRECFELLSVERLDDGAGETIEVERSDGLIDLSPAVGFYQEALFFDGYDAAKEIKRDRSEIAKRAARKLGKGPWADALLLAAVSTNQLRYAEQVTATIPERVEAQLVERLGSLLPSDCISQAGMLMKGVVSRTRTQSTDVAFVGIVDAIHDGEAYELKFVSELSHPMFLQLALYLVMGRLESGILWNTRTDERWRVRVPDAKRFMNAVARCVTKEHYKAFKRTA